ncbi:MAG: phage head-tail adapter protein [Variovorax sp.]|nr:phage head-tail adapter protein [Variovorax sp.]
MAFDPSRSLLAGRSTGQLQADLANAQQAYIDLMSGAKGESYSYTQGDGARSVTYTRANVADLASLIQLLQAQLGIVTRPRRPIAFRFR